MKLNFVWILFCSFALVFGVFGCAQKVSTEKTIQVSPVSPEEARLIRLRLSSGLVIHPYEQIEFGSRFVKGPGDTTEPESTRPAVFSLDLSPPQILPPLKNPTEIEKLVEFLLTIRKASLRYFEAYPTDQALYRKLEASISEDTCFTDGSSSYCGPPVLVGSMFSLGNPASETALHEEWLPAIESARTLASPLSQSSAALENFVRNFVFGSFKFLVASSSIFTESNCRAAHERLNNNDLDDEQKKTFKEPEKWEINPCILILFSHKSKQTALSRGL